MRKAEVEVGRHYRIRHHGESGLSVVQILRENQRGGYDCLKLSTGRTIRVKSAAKFREEVIKVDGEWTQV